MPRWFSNNNQSSQWNGVIENEYLEKAAEAEEAIAPWEGASQILYDNYALHKLLDVWSILFAFWLLYECFTTNRFEKRHAIFFFTLVLRLAIPELSLITGALALIGISRRIYYATNLSINISTWCKDNLNKRKELEAELNKE